MNGATFWVFSVILMLTGSVAIAGEGKRMSELKITSPVFSANGFIPSRYTCDGGDVNPPLEFAGAPAETKSLALIVDDPDAPVGMWVHWVVWNIDPATGEIAEDHVPPNAIQGKNDWKRNSYGGPCPPSGVHRYYFKLYALDTRLTLEKGAAKGDLERAMKGHILASAELIGLYKRR